MAKLVITLINNETSYSNFQINVSSIISVFNEAFEAAIAMTLRELKALNEMLPEEEVVNVVDIIYNADHKTLLDRVNPYVKETEQKLKNGISIEEAKMYLTNMLVRIIENEIRNIKKSLREKATPTAEIYIVDICGCEKDCDCYQHSGIWAADDDSHRPPFHVNCHCEDYAYFDETDDEELIKELGLEDEVDSIDETNDDID